MRVTKNSFVFWGYWETSHCLRAVMWQWQIESLVHSHPDSSIKAILFYKSTIIDLDVLYIMKKTTCHYKFAVLNISSWMICCSLYPYLTGNLERGWLKKKCHWHSQYVVQTPHREISCCWVRKRTKPYIRSLWEDFTKNYNKAKINMP